jgi:hypothetical protein
LKHETFFKKEKKIKNLKETTHSHTLTDWALKKVQPHCIQAAIKLKQENALETNNQMK